MFFCAEWSPNTTKGKSVVIFSTGFTPVWIGIGVGVPVLLIITGIVVALVVLHCVKRCGVNLGCKTHSDFQAAMRFPLQPLNLESYHDLK